MANSTAKGHLAALITILIWGTTFISTKVLLVDFQPIEILFFRFLMGLLALLIVYPHRLKGTTIKQESVFVAAGLCGVCLYYLLENIALTYTMASNVGVIISVAPFFTAILSHLFLKQDEKLRANFFIGFIVAMLGIGLISFNGASLQLNPIGDLLALLAAFLWACYSILTRKISSFGYNTILTTRRVFFYGILFMMGITLGKKMPEVVGADVTDKTGNDHLGIIEFPVPILKGNAESIKAIRERLYEPDFSDLTVVDFSDLAQGCKTYDEFIEKMKEVSEIDLNYLGIAICGSKKKVNKLTGSMPLLR